MIWYFVDVQQILSRKELFPLVNHCFNVMIPDVFYRGILQQGWVTKFVESFTYIYQLIAIRHLYIWSDSLWKYTVKHVIMCCKHNLATTCLNFVPLIWNGRHWWYGRCNMVDSPGMHGCILLMIMYLSFIYYISPCFKGVFLFLVVINKLFEEFPIITKRVRHVW